MAKKEQSEAAAKIEKAAKAKKAGSAKKKENIFVRIGKWFAKFFKDLKGDIKKITWPNGKTVLKSTLVVIVSIAVIGLAVFLVDLALSKGVDGLESLASHYSQSQTADEESADKKEDSKTADAAAKADAAVKAGAVDAKAAE